MTEQTATTIVYTTAPEAADYEWLAKSVEVFEHSLFQNARPLTWRKVEITADPYRTAYQCDRYRSFLVGIVTLDDPRVWPLTGRDAPTNSLPR